MKKHLLPLLFLFSICNSIFAQQWYNVPSSYISDVNSVQIFNVNNVLMGGGYSPMDQAVYFCNNYGLSFGIISDVSAPRINSIAFRDSLNGVAACESGALLKSVNGGVNWSSHAPVNAYFNHVIYTDTSTLIAVGGSPFGDSLQVIVKSINGGNSWNVVYNVQGKWLKSVCFADVLHGIAVGDSGSILKTINGGTTWTPVTAPVQRDFNAVSFTNDTTGFIVGGKETSDSMRTILKTIDGGATWNVVKDEINAWLKDISFLNQDTGYAVGPLATILKTTNAGQTWSQDVLNGATGTEYFNTIRFKGTSFGFVAGKSGTVFVYTYAQIPEAYTYSADATGGSSVTLKALLNTHGATGEYSFIYSTDSTFANASYTYTTNIFTNALDLIDHPYLPFTSDTTYYYSARLRTILGNVGGDTLRFFNGTIPYTLQTDSAADVTDSTVIVYGSVNKMPYPVNLIFEYDTTPAFKHAVTSSPGFINDTLQHTINAALVSLVPDKLYFYRLRGTTASNIFYTGDIKGFYTGKLYSNLETQSAYVFFDTTVAFHGAIAGFRVPVKVSFEYGNTLPLQQLSGSTVYSDTSSYSVWENAFVSPYASLYYYRIKAETQPASLFGTYYGNTLTFQTSNAYSGFQTLSATSVNSTSAQLNGMVDKLTLSTTISFDYGITSSLGNTVAATPANINDTLQHHIVAQLNGLLPNTVYYYRLRGSVGSNINFTGGMKQLYTGSCEIPNCDFEVWDTTLFEMPNGWNITGEVHRVPSYNGTSSVEFRGGNMNHLGGIILGQPKGPIPTGFSFAARPDSIQFYARYNIMPGDTGYVALFFTLHDTLINQEIFPITGNSGGNFILKKYKINFSTADVPDSLGMIFLSANGFSADPPTMSNPLSVLAIDDISFTGTNLNVPNHDFEQWGTSALDNPQAWHSNPDNQFVPTTVFDPIIKTTDHVSGNYAVQLQNNPLQSIKSTYIKTGIGDQFNVPTFPVGARHTILNGYVKYLPQNGDTLVIYTTMYKNGILIGAAYVYIDTAITSYQPFSFDINYLNINGTDIPDSADIYAIIGPTGSHGNSVAYLDNLSFDGFRTGIKSPNIADKLNCQVYPNPAINNLTVEISGFTGKLVYTIYDIIGRNILRVGDNSDHTGRIIKNLNVSSLQAGTYLIQVQSEKTSVTRKFIIQK